MPDPERRASVSPGIGPVGGALVGEDALDRDAVVGEPGGCAFEDSDRGDGFLVSADLGVATREWSSMTV